VVVLLLVVAGRSVGSRVPLVVVWSTIILLSLQQTSLTIGKAQAWILASLHFDLHLKDQQCMAKMYVQRDHTPQQRIVTPMS